MSILSAMQYSHWLMVAGAVLVALGFIGFAFRQNKNVVEPNHDPLKSANTSWTAGGLRPPK